MERFLREVDRLSNIYAAIPSFDRDQLPDYQVMLYDRLTVATVYVEYASLEQLKTQTNNVIETWRLLRPREQMTVAENTRKAVEGLSLITA